MGQYLPKLCSIKKGPVFCAPCRFAYTGPQLMLCYYASKRIEFDKQFLSSWLWLTKDVLPSVFRTHRR